MTHPTHFESIVRFLFPADMLDYFEITQVISKSEHLEVHLKEQNIPPVGYKSEDLLAKDFLPSITIQDFPIRGKAMFLRIRRRRWTEKSSGKIICRDWELTAKGTKFTKEFGSFLKELNR